MEPMLKKAAKRLSESRLTVALTGAGISVESGIPPFRGPGSLWESIDPMEFAHIDAFMRHPDRVWEVLIKGLKEMLAKARPNRGHLALAELENRGLLTAIITQNVDSLHQKAGNREVIEFHGTFAQLSCLSCHTQIPITDISTATLPPRCPCGGIYRPNCIFFGEAIPGAALEHALTLADQCDVMLVVGTSAMVQPAATLPLRAKKQGATLIEVNPSPTPLTPLCDLFLQGNAGTVLPRLTEATSIPAGP